MKTYAPYSCFISIKGVRHTIIVPQKKNCSEKPFMSMITVYKLLTATGDEKFQPTAILNTLLIL